MPRKAAPGYLPVMTTIHQAVRLTGKHNFEAAKIQLPSNLNFKRWEQMAQGYHDAEVVNFLKFGFPVSYQGPIPDPASENHS